MYKKPNKRIKINAKWVSGVIKGKLVKIWIKPAIFKINIAALPKNFDIKKFEIAWMKESSRASKIYCANSLSKKQ